LKLEEKYVALENGNIKIDKELRRKEQEYKQLLEEHRILQEKKEHYKNSLMERDETINELRRQIEEDQEKFNNEIYRA
jgi:hypothetical protein